MRTRTRRARRTTLARSWRTPGETLVIQRQDRYTVFTYLARFRGASHFVNVPRDLAATLIARARAGTTRV